MAKIFKNRKIILLDEVDSTNTYVNKLGSNITDGSVVLAGLQTNGKGQGGNIWESEKGMNLTFSIRVYPDFLKAIEQFYLSKIISLAVADLINLYTANVTVKWPNDIYCGHKKIAGILIENSIMGEYLKDAVIGVGINVNQSKFLSDAPNPISMGQITGETYDLMEILDIFLSIFDFRYTMLKESDFDTIDQNYFDLLYRRGVLAEFIAGGQKLKGTITGVGKTGELEISDEKGDLRRFWHKEVEFVL